METLIIQIKQLAYEANQRITHYGSSDDDIDNFADDIIELIKKYYTENK